jgi:hypothetical protein
MRGSRRGRGAQSVQSSSQSDENWQSYGRMSVLRTQRLGAVFSEELGGSTRDSGVRRGTLGLGV